MANSKELAFLRREVTCLDRARKTTTAGIEVDQRLLWRRFRALVDRSRVLQAAMNGDRALESRLRAQTGRRRREVGTAGCDYDSAWNLERVLGGDCFREQMADFRPQPPRNGRSTPPSPSQSRNNNSRGGCPTLPANALTSPISSCTSRSDLEKSFDLLPPPANVFHLTAVDTDCNEHIIIKPPKVDSTKGRLKKRTKTRLSQKESAENDLLGKSLARMTIDRSLRDVNTRRRQLTAKHRDGTAPVSGKGGTVINPSLVDIQLRIVREVSTEQLKRVNVFCSQLDAVRDETAYDRRTLERGETTTSERVRPVKR